MELLNPPSGSSRRRSGTIWAAALIVALAVALPRAAGLDITPPAVPGNLIVTDGSTPYLIGHASGTQDYMCVLSQGGFAWAFFGPQATLFDDYGQQLMTHFLSPNPDENGAARATWQHSADTSSVWAVAVANSTDTNYVAPGAIPWLLLRVVGESDGALVGTTFIQRVNTAGGVAPATGCSRAADIGKKALVPYTTDYVFYKQ